jgi:hypothetical protein
VFDGHRDGGTRDGSVTDGNLPTGFVRKLSRLGFVLVQGDRPYTFVRLTTDGEFRLLVQESAGGAWRVGMVARAMNQPGRAPHSFLAVSLTQFGPSPDGTTLELSTQELTGNFPRALKNSILPTCDLAPS